MGSVGDPPQTTPRKASEWLLALREAPNDGALKESFEAWLSASPAHLADWRDIQRTVAVLHELQQDRGWRPAARPAVRPTFYNRRTVFGLAAIALFAVLAILAWPAFELEIRADHQTATAEQKNIVLPDGSQVRLAPRSAIGIEYTDEERRVLLLRGEAFFDVRDAASRPFVVEASNIRATDLGTSFDVRLGSASTEVAVRQGRVRVDAAQASPPVSEVLEAGDWFRLQARQPAERGHVPAEEVGAWTRNLLIVKRQPIPEIVEALRPYFNGMIVLWGEELQHSSLTGVYNLADPVGALHAVARAQGATVRQLSPWLLILSGT